MDSIKALLEVYTRTSGSNSMSAPPGQSASMRSKTEASHCNVAAGKALLLSGSSPSSSRNPISSPSTSASGPTLMGAVRRAVPDALGLSAASAVIAAEA